MKKFSQRKHSEPDYLRQALQLLNPPEQLSVSQWAEKHRVLDARSSALPGPWRNEQTPYLVGIMDEFSNYETEEIIFCKPTQVGGTEVLLNMLGSIIDTDPAPTMIVYPTDTLAESTSTNRIDPMLLASPRIAAKYRIQESKRLELQFDGMYLTLSGANSPSSLASKPIKNLFLDEVDKYPAASKKEADPISLARERTKTFTNRKIYMCSTPTLRTGPIWKAKEAADVEKHYFVPCVHCGEYIELDFHQIKWPDETSGLSDADRAEQACYVCQCCGAILTDADKMTMLRRGQWRPVRQKAAAAKTVAFWLNTLYSPFTRFGEIAKAFLLAKDDPDELHNFVNSWLAEPWEETRSATNADLVLEHQTETEAYTVPAWAKLLTGGIDVQESSLYWTIRAWGDYITSQNIAHGQALGWAEIERIMNLSFPQEDSGEMLVDLALIDSGDQTDEVYDFCANNSDWALACKGVAGSNSHYRITTVNKTGTAVDGMRLVLVDGGKYKDMIASRLRRENGRGSWMVYKDCDRDYAEQVTAEHKITERSHGREVTKWVPKTSHAANHYLDAEVYAMAAADVLGVRSLFLQEQEAAKPAPRNDPKPQPEEYRPEESWINANENWI